jgi:tetratricopeptide (TPR) repeat protein
MDNAKALWCAVASFASSGKRIQCARFHRITATVPEILAQVMHGDPPAPSSLRTDLNRAHDDLCFRLLAREPADRFTSAQDAATAIRSVTTGERVEEGRHENRAPSVSLPRRSWWRSRLPAAAVILTLVAVALASGWRWLRPSMPPPPADAQVWFQKGTEALREGAYYSAAKAFEEGIRQFPDAPTSYARLAEARAELDDQAGAHDALLKLSEHFPNESVLPVDDRLRVEAMRWLVTRDLEKSVGAYNQVVERNPKDAGAWVDLGRAQETAVQLEDAKASLQRAIALDPQLPAAYLHLGIVESFEGHGEQSLATLDQAERLYRTASNTEGQTEVLIRKGALFDSQGDFDKARPALESAIRAAQAIQSQYHVLRAQLALSAVTASDGRFVESERLSTTATATALDSDLDVVAADGLVDLAATLLFADRLADAERTLEKANRLATKRGAVRTIARVQMQIASLRLQQLDAAGALKAVEPALAVFRQGHYLKLELIGLNIAARAHGRLDHVGKAYELATKAVAIAEATRNDSQIAESANTLAGQSANLGSLPEALALRTRAQAIHRRQHDMALLPYDLTNRAELLIQLGRLDEASMTLGEVEEGISKKVEGYAGRQTRVTALRTFAAIVAGNPLEAARIAEPFVVTATKTDSSTVLVRCLLQYATANRNSKQLLPLPGSATLSPATERDLQYWVSLSHEARGEFQQSLTVASEGLQRLSEIANDELRWRLSAVGTIAARQSNQAERERAMRTIANESLTRLRNSWGQAGRTYDSRRDLIQLRTRARL